MLFGTFRGFVKGLVLEVIGIFALIIAIWLGIELMDWGVQFISYFTSEYQSFLPYLSFFLIFFFVLLVITISGRILKSALNLTILGAVDNFAGAFLGLLKWAFAVSLLFWLAESMGIPISEDIRENSLIYPMISAIAPVTIHFLSDNMPFMNDFFNSLKEIFRDN
jgi:membrane protein required for colicin V production